MATLDRIVFESGESERQGKSQLKGREVTRDDFVQALFKVIMLLSIITVSISSVIPRVYPERLSTHCRVFLHKRRGIV